MTDSISAAAIVAAVAPYGLALLPVAIGWAAAEVRRRTGFQISQGAVDKLDTLAKAEAGALIAASPTNLAGVSIPVASPMVADAAARVLAVAPKILEDAGLSPAAVATMVAGHLGAMQAQMPPAAPTPAPAAALAKAT